MIVQIGSAVLRAILAHARAEAPNECCGLLVGAGLAVAGAVPARNVRASPTRFLIDPADHFRTIRLARLAGLRVIGAYHSHPASDPVPSATDLAESHDAELVHMIVSLRAGSADAVRCYRLPAAGVGSGRSGAGTAVEELALKVTWWSGRLWLGRARLTLARARMRLAHRRPPG
jgi:proteasome lid subunit RPN8/RPN11